MEGVIPRWTNEETTKPKIPLLSQQTLIIPLHFSRGRLVKKASTLPQFRAQQSACDIHTYFSPKWAMTVQQLACACATGSATTLLEELEAPSSFGVRTESHCKAKQREAFLLGGFNLMAMEGKHSEKPRIALPQPLLAEAKQKTCLSQACSGHRAGTSIFWNFNTSTLSTLFSSYSSQWGWARCLFEFAFKSAGWPLPCIPWNNNYVHFGNSCWSEIEINTLSSMPAS